MLRRPPVFLPISALLTISLGLSAVVAPYQVVAEEADVAAEGGGSGQSPGEKLIAKVDLSYVFSGGSSDLELEILAETESESQDAADLEDFIEEVDSNPIYEPDQINPEPMASERGQDYVGDDNGRGGQAGDGPVWEGAYADTLLRTQMNPSASAAHPASRSRTTSFESGYIPEYGEAPRLVDEAPSEGDYVDAQRYSRLPNDWTVPPGGAAHPANPDQRRFYEEYPAYSNYSSAGSYRSSYGPAGYSYDSQYLGHHPEGPYSYRFGVQDPFWNNEGRTFRQGANYELRGSWPIFTSRFNPDDAHLKVGPLYLQVVSAEVGVLYSDYDWPQVFRPVEEDGWLGFVGFRLRAAARVAPNVYFTLDGRVIYLIGAGEVGFGLRATDGLPFARFEYTEQAGPWDIRVYDHFGSFMPFALGDEDGAFERAGRYSFGFLGYDGGRTGFLRDPVIYNRVGIQADRPIDESWRLSLEADRTDSFFLDSDRTDDHRGRNHAGVTVSAEPGQIPFSPYVSYDVYQFDDTSGAYHTFYTGGRGRLSEHVTADGRVGYLFGTRDSWLWDFGLRHQLCERTAHGIRFGQDFRTNDFTGDALVSDYVHYYLTHNVTDHTRFYGFAQWSRDEFLTGLVNPGTYDRHTYGVRLIHRVNDYVNASLGYRVDNWESDNARRAGRERSIFDARLNAQLAPRTNGYLHYRSTNDDLFDEDLYLAGVRRYF